MEKTITPFDKCNEHNSLADGLSKQALKLDMVYGTFSENLDGMVINHGHFVLF